MSCDLDKYFSGLYSELPLNDGESFLFDVNTFKLTFDSIATDKLIILKGDRCYGDSLIVDMVMFCCQKETYSKLGLCLLSILFSADVDSFDINLLSPETDIKTIRVEKKTKISKKNGVGYYEQPFCFRYYSQKICFFPFENKKICQEDYPEFVLGYSQSNIEKGLNRDDRELIKGLGSERGLANFAQLVLDFGSFNNVLDEVHLESFPGQQGVGVRSSEISLLLPDSDWLS